MQVAPDSAEAWMRLGSCRFQLEQHGPAVPPLRRAVHLLSLANSPSAAPVLQDSLWLLIQVPVKLCGDINNAADIGKITASALRPEVADRLLTAIIFWVMWRTQEISTLPTL